MKKTIPVAVLAGFLFASLGVSAKAEDITTTVTHPSTIKIGAFFPSNGNDSNAAGATQFSVGLDYALLKTNQEQPIIPSGYFDYEGGSRSGGFVDTFALGVAVRSQGVTKPGVNPYYGLGVGAYDVDAHKLGNSSGSGVTFGGKVFAGLEWKDGLLVEVNYQIINDVKDVNPSGLGVQVGVRF